jgi:hypothetical protein
VIGRRRDATKVRTTDRRRGRVRTAHHRKEFVMRLLFRLGVLALAGVGAKSVYDKYLVNLMPSGSGSTGSNSIDLSGTARAGERTGYDTPTGTDPGAKYSEPGYQDKSFGQAVAQDGELVDRLLDETGGNVAAAESEFRTASAGAPALAKQEGDTGSSR